MVATLSGKKVVVTGRIADGTRPQIEARLRAAGATTFPRMTADIDVLVMGEDVGKVKTDAARKYGIDMITWSEAKALLEGASTQAATVDPRSVQVETRKAPRAGIKQVDPMKCLKADGLPSGDDWQFEVKWDGHRCVAVLNGGEVTLATKSWKSDYTKRFQPITDELLKVALVCEAVIDGEVVALDEQGRSNLQLLSTGVTRYVMFDLLEYNGVNLRDEPLTVRRAKLEELGDMIAELALPRLAVSPAFDDGPALWAYAEEQDLEGIVAKRLSSRYKEGTRGQTWLKIKRRVEQEFVVVGYTPGEGQRAGTIGAALLAVVDDAGEFVYCGSVGTGGTIDDWKALEARLTPVVNGPSCKHDLPRAETRDVTWVLPEVVVQVRFQNWTNGDRIFHPSLQGVREDKQPHEVVRET